MESSVSTRDQQLLERAIELGRNGLGSVSPNPQVGAVVARDGEVLGEGWHERCGEAHAEVNAIADCGGADLTGATLYVSLEPCCHEGRQPACTDAITAAGIARVVVASDDPTEKASGRGLGILRDEGVEVELASGDLAATARLENQAFRKHARTGKPWVLFKSAMSIDGKVATSEGDSQWISDASSRELVHVWRAEVDAVAVGIGTAMADDPQLTVRTPGAERQPRRIVFDSDARLALDSQLVSQAPEVELIVVVSRAAPRSAIEALESAGAEVVVVSGENEPLRVSDALSQLGKLDPPVTSLLLEGGPHLAGAFFDAGEIDEIRLFIAPLVLGGANARDPLEGMGATMIADATRALSLTTEIVADDVLLTARLREW
ncbi:MAG: bifunctional diaminohydroxyphosphoribosylaminopyrimidine deaminase/5-amino-6-(5-phosphoribosylamino)uracil reductase RibD [Solirubrobacteraceae bacterium]|nr:bifunctional diaminohydroxyphosphoribosylaminopyrimidine deaminase/5-amino-6-(5-phosphoribosylamino)uracil reductase RibD [Solirubrobacteraceae bacterium]